MKLIDLSHEIEHAMVTYPGLPAPVLSEHLSRPASRERYSGQAEFHIGRIDMIANTGTYLDAPFHRFENGADVGQLPLEKIAFLRGVVVTLPADTRALTASAVTGLDVRDAAVLIRTGWSTHWRTPGYGAADHPFVSEEAAEHLARAGAALVGIDSINIDDIADLRRPAHTTLLKHGVLIVEHLTNLDAIANGAFTFFAIPAPVRGMGTFPVRAFAAIG
jgi:kynurenine formamidase